MINKLNTELEWGIENNNMIHNNIKFNEQNKWGLTTTRAKCTNFLNKPTILI